MMHAILSFFFFNAENKGVVSLQQHNKFHGFCYLLLLLLHFFFLSFHPPPKLPETLILPEVKMHEVAGRGMRECMTETSKTPLPLTFFQGTTTLLPVGSITKPDHP